jgi:hypothetical protein
MQEELAQGFGHNQGCWLLTPRTSAEKLAGLRKLRWEKSEEIMVRRRAGPSFRRGLGRNGCSNGTNRFPVCAPRIAPALQ